MKRTARLLTGCFIINADTYKKIMRKQANEAIRTIIDFTKGDDKD